MAGYDNIVIKIENNKVYTVEGNSTDDTCRQLEYSINSNILYIFDACLLGRPIFHILK